MDYSPITRGGQISGRELRSMAAFGGAIASSWCLGPLGGLAAAAGIILLQGPEEIWVQITGAQKVDLSYPFVQVVEISPAVFGVPDSQITDTAISLFEVNNTAGVANNTTLRAWLSDDGTHYLFAAPEGSISSGLTVKDASGAPSFSASTLQFDKSTGINVAQDAITTQADITLLAASATQMGAVNTSAQTMGNGVKTFQTGVVVNSSNGFASSDNGFIVQGTTGVTDKTQLMVDNRTSSYQVNGFASRANNGTVRIGGGLQAFVLVDQSAHGVSDNTQAVSDCVFMYYPSGQLLVGRNDTSFIFTLSSGGTYAVGSSNGVTGTGGGGDTVTGGIITALGAAGLNGTFGG